MRAQVILAIFILATTSTTLAAPADSTVLTFYCERALLLVDPPLVSIVCLEDGTEPVPPTRVDEDAAPASSKTGPATRDQQKGRRSPGGLPESDVKKSD
jgi:hypothetical protein